MTLYASKIATQRIAHTTDIKQIERLAQAKANDVVVALGQPLEKDDGCDEAVRFKCPLCCIDGSFGAYVYSPATGHLCAYSPASSQ
jgi:hypothetical protein